MTTTTFEAVKIELERGEGPIDLCSTKVFYGPGCIEACAAQIRENARTAPSKGYNKHYLKVYIAEGGTTWVWTHRLDVTCNTQGFEDVLAYLDYLKDTPDNAAPENQVTIEAMKQMFKI